MAVVVQVDCQIQPFVHSVIRLVFLNVYNKDKKHKSFMTGYTGSDQVTHYNSLLHSINERATCYAESEPSSDAWYCTGPQD